MTADGPRTWLLPEEPAPVRLMNTIWADRSGIRDDLRTPADLAAWLAEVEGRGPRRITAHDLDQARRLRDALRGIAAHCTGDDRPSAGPRIEEVAAAIRVVNELAARHAAPRLVLDGDELRADQAASAGVESALAELAVDAIELFTAPDAPELGACHAPGCVLFFVRSHPRREWCCVACGNRARAARHYRRHHGT